MLTRYANAAMRCRQYAEARCALALDRIIDEPAVEMTIFDLGHALHVWRRQMSLWFAFYRSKQVQALVGPKAVPDVKTPGLADLDAKMKLQRVHSVQSSMCWSNLHCAHSLCSEVPLSEGERGKTSKVRLGSSQRPLESWHLARG